MMEDTEIKQEFGETEDSKNDVSNNRNIRSQREQFRRKQKRHISNQKGFGRKGIFGRGTHLDDEQGNYFLQISDILRNDFDSVEDKSILANNTLSTCTGNEVNYSSNQVASRVIESLVPYADGEVLEIFLNEFSQNFRPLCSDPFASHVLQKLIEISFLRGVSNIQNDEGSSNEKKFKPDSLDEFDYNLTTTFTNKHIKSCFEFVLKASKFLLNNLEDFVWDQYANHIIRSCLSNLVGIFVKKDTRPNARFVEEKKILNVPDEWKEIILEYANRLILWPQIPEFPYSEFSSGIIQSLLPALKICDKSKLKSFGKKLIEQSFIVSDDNKLNDLPKVFTSEPSIRLLEKMIATAGNKLLHTIYTTLFVKRLENLSKMRSANFTVQKLLDNVKEVNDFDAIYDELSPEIESLLKIGHTGVVLALAQACLRLKSKQAAFIKSMQTSLHCLNQTNEISNLFPLLVLKLKPYKVYVDDKSNFIHTHGSLILQAMINFNKPIIIVNNMLSLNNEILANVFKTPAGSRVVDAFVQSKTIGDKSREKIIRHMQGTYLDMAMSRNGSRAFEAFFNAAGDKQKEYLMKELSEKSGLLGGSQSGKIIASKYRVNVFASSTARWKAEFNSKNKARDMFKDIIN